MAEKNINKVIYGGKTLIDLTSDTATADKVLSGYTFHDNPVRSLPVQVRLTVIPVRILLPLRKSWLGKPLTPEARN